MRRLLIVCNDSWFFASHRLPIAKRAIRDGYEVHVAARNDHTSELLTQAGCIHHTWNLEPRGKNPVTELRSVFSLYTIARAVKPDLMHLVTIKPVIYGGIVARLARIPAVVYAISGIGSVYVSTGTKAALIRKFVKKFHRFALGHKNSIVIFQNKDDRATLENNLNLRDKKSLIIDGSGVDLNEFAYSDPPSAPPVVLLLAARLLRDKGIGEFALACQKLLAKGYNIEPRVAGGHLADGNPAAYSKREVAQLASETGVNFLSHQDNVVALMRDAHIIVLPSYREGFPKVLIEAAAVGRAVITTDVPGCRDAIENNRTGLLVPAKDVDSLAQAMETLVEDEQRRVEMGIAGREMAEARFSIDVVVDAHIAAYNSLMKDTRFSES